MDARCREIGESHHVVVVRVAKLDSRRLHAKFEQRPMFVSHDTSVVRAKRECPLFSRRFVIATARHYASCRWLHLQLHGLTCGNA
jgi:hypothetical protein